MKRLYVTLNDWFESIPTPFLVVLARLAIAGVFLRSGLWKLNGMNDGTTLAMFTNEITIPLLPAEVTAWLFTIGEIGLAALIFIGLLTRFAAFGLLVLTVITALFYPSVIDMYAVYAVSLLFLMRHGAGRFSLDYLISSRMALTSHHTAHSL
jgi:putative oxidoreductase